MNTVGIPHQTKKAWQLVCFPSDISKWKTAGLPQNDNGMENAMMLEQSLKKCLLIDPQHQAVSFIKNLART
jgi:hypothetical protein